MGEQLSETTNPKSKQRADVSFIRSARNTLKARTPGEETRRVLALKWLGYRLSIEPDHLPLTFA